MKPCKVCISKNRSLYDELYLVKNKRLTDIHKISVLLGDNFSIMSLSRHFKNHVKRKEKDTFRQIEVNDVCRILVYMFDDKSIEEQKKLIAYWKQNDEIYFQELFYSKETAYDELLKFITNYNSNLILEFKAFWIEMWNRKKANTLKTWNQYFGYDNNDSKVIKDEDKRSKYDYRIK